MKAFSIDESSISKPYEAKYKTTGCVGAMKIEAITQDIFDITDTADLPFIVGKKKSTKYKILDLYNTAARPLTVIELKVGFFRTHNKEMAEHHISTINSKLCIEGKIKRIKNGCFEITQQGMESVIF